MKRYLLLIPLIFASCQSWDEQMRLGTSRGVKPVVRSHTIDTHDYLSPVY